MAAAVLRSLRCIVVLMLPLVLLLLVARVDARLNYRSARRMLGSGVGEAPLVIDSLPIPRECHFFVECMDVDAVADVCVF